MVALSMTPWLWPVLSLDALGWLLCSILGATLGLMWTSGSFAFHVRAPSESIYRRVEKSLQVDRESEPASALGYRQSGASPAAVTVDGTRFDGGELRGVHVMIIREHYDGIGLIRRAVAFVPTIFFRTVAYELDRCATLGDARALAEVLAWACEGEASVVETRDCEPWRPRALSRGAWGLVMVRSVVLAMWLVAMNYAWVNGAANVGVVAMLGMVAADALWAEWEGVRIARLRSALVKRWIEEPPMSAQE